MTVTALPLNEGDAADNGDGHSNDTNVSNQGEDDDDDKSEGTHKEDKLNEIPMPRLVPVSSDNLRRSAERMIEGTSGPEAKVGQGSTTTGYVPLYQRNLQARLDRINRALQEDADQQPSTDSSFTQGSDAPVLGSTSSNNPHSRGTDRPGSASSTLDKVLTSGFNRPSSSSHSSNPHSSSSSPSSTPSSKPRRTPPRPSRLAMLALFIALMASVCASYVAYLSSARNYPGGYALVKLNKYLSLEGYLHARSVSMSLPSVNATSGDEAVSVNLSPRVLNVHLGNIACISGVTRFGYLLNYRHAFVLPHNNNDTDAQAPLVNSDERRTRGNDISSFLRKTGNQGHGGHSKNDEDLDEFIRMLERGYVDVHKIVTDSIADNSHHHHHSSDASHGNEHDLHHHNTLFPSSKTGTTFPLIHTSTKLGYSGIDLSRVRVDVDVRYSKEEGIDRSSLWSHPDRFDYLLSEYPSVPGFTVLDVITGFDSVGFAHNAAIPLPSTPSTDTNTHDFASPSRLQGVGEIFKAVLRGSMYFPPRLPMLEIRERPQVYIHKRKPDT